MRRLSLSSSRLLKDPRVHRERGVDPALAAPARFRRQVPAAQSLRRARIRRRKRRPRTKRKLRTVVDQLRVLAPQDARKGGKAASKPKAKPPKNKNEKKEKENKKEKKQGKGEKPPKGGGNTEEKEVMKSGKKDSYVFSNTTLCGRPWTQRGGRSRSPTPSSAKPRKCLNLIKFSVLSELDCLGPRTMQRPLSKTSRPS